MNRKRLRESDQQDSDEAVEPSEQLDPEASDIFDAELTKKWAPISQLLSELNKLNLGEDVKSKLPRVVICGIQSAGKSSVVEMLIGFECLPRGDGTVTRRPTEVYITRDPTHKEPFFEVQDTKTKEISTFKSLKQFQEKIISLNVGLESFIKEAVIARIRWARAFNFIITDIPGILATETITEEITMGYIKEANTIILCVLPAHTEEKVSQAFQATSKVDPNFERTLFVRTKGDLLLNDPGKKIEGALTINEKFNESTFLTLNRTSEDIEKKTTIRDVFVNEEKLRRLDPSFIDRYFPRLRNSDGFQAEIRKFNKQIGALNLIQAVIEKFTEKVKLCYPSILQKLKDERERYISCLRLLPEKITKETRDQKFVEFSNELLESFRQACTGDILGVYDAIEPFIRNKSAAKFNLQKKYLADKVDGDPIETLLIWMEANGMQPLREHICQVYLSKCVQSMLKQSKRLTEMMFDDIHRHIISKIGLLLEQSKFNQTMRRHFMEQVEPKIKNFKVDTEGVMEKLFIGEMEYPQWEPEDLQKEQAFICFEYIDEKKSNAVRQVCSLSRLVMERKFIEKFNCDFRVKEVTEVTIKIKTESVLTDLQKAQESGDPKKQIALPTEIPQSGLRVHLWEEFNKNKKKHPRIEWMIANGILHSNLNKIEDQIPKIIDTSMKSYAFCYYLLHGRKTSAAALICSDYLKRIKVAFSEIVRNHNNLEMMGDDPENMAKRQNYELKISDLERAINMLKDFSEGSRMALQ